ncbi:hypothetical protein EN822_20460 [bacterium M00.F.Ca.ET.179.01.1.1]|nr:hypothetical protein EN822_20460 [bacterium M00.F.Ca.ET.179.01.1.1]TGV45826.1 hypothetical protein EN811_20460 [bacterium M00.F.Ca.ET.168.01.1.1]
MANHFARSVSSGIDGANSGIVVSRPCVTASLAPNLSIMPYMPTAVLQCADFPSIENQIQPANEGSECVSMQFP